MKSLEVATSCLMVCIVLSSISNALKRMTKEVQTFNGNGFSHLVYSNVTDYLYVGGVNRISQLKVDTLNEVARLMTGPRLDHTYCVINDPCGKVCKQNCEEICRVNHVPSSLCKTRQTNTIVRGMTIDSSYLYVCYNIRLGFCQRLLLKDIAVVVSNSSHSVVCSDPNSRVSMMVGRNPRSRFSKAIYFAVTKCNASFGPVNQLPSLSTRRLDNFNLVQFNTKSSSWLIKDSMRDIRGDQAHYFKIFYRYMFSYRVPNKPPEESTVFTYTLVVQPEAPQSKVWVTRLGRVCQDDTFYLSYIEMTLRCKGTNEEGLPVDYNIAETAYLSHVGTDLASRLGIKADDLVLFVTFRSTKHNMGLERLGKGAVCLYTMPEIQRMYRTIIKNCIQYGNMNIGPSHFEESSMCQPRVSDEVLRKIDSDGYCHKERDNSPMSGYTSSEKIMKVALLEFYTMELDSILTGNVSQRFTQLLLGSHTGEFLQYELQVRDGKISPRKIDSIQLGNHPVVQLVQAKQTQFVYALSSEKVSKIRLFKCSQFRTCQSCLSAKVPHCGWCIRSGRCLQRRACTKRNDHWIPFSNGLKCPTITAIHPTGVQVNTNIPQYYETLHMRIKHLPMELLAKCTPKTCSCNFTTGSLESRRKNDSRTKYASESLKVARRGESYDLSCDTPHMELMPPIPAGKDHVAVNVSITIDSKDIMWTEFYIFDCAQYKTCSSCVNSSFQCDWCILQNTCRARFHSSTKCIVQALVNHNQILECPRFSHSPTVIRQSSGMEFRGLTLQVHPPLKSLMEMSLENFYCEVTCPGMDSKVVGALTNTVTSEVTCKDFTMWYAEENGRLLCQLKLLWILNTETGGEKRYLENRDNTSVELYKCQHMVDSCGECLLDLDAAYNCGWCSAMKQCSLQRNCEMKHRWLKRTEICSNPSIMRISPMNATHDSSVFVTIYGKNLGRKFDDIKDNVILRVIGGRPLQCETMPDGYVPGKKIKCMIRAERWRSPASGRFHVKVAGMFDARSDQVFQFLEPKFFNVTPSFGPKSGGTRICIYGANLAIGSDRRVKWQFVTDRRPESLLSCDIISASNSRICCRTSESPMVGKVMLQVIFDGKEISPAPELTTFSYEADPRVTRVFRTSSITRGGLPVLVEGSNLLVPSHARLRLSRGDLSVVSECRRNDTEMLCLTPDASSLLPSRVRRQASTRGTGLRYGFEMDGVSALRDLGEMTLFPDPYLEPFPGGRLLRGLSQVDGEEEESLKLSGRNLGGGAITAKDIQVRVGDKTCGVLTLKGDSLICMLARPEGGMRAAVTVQVGENLFFRLGELVYRAETAFSHQMMTIILIVVGVMVCLIIVFIVLCVYRCQSRAKIRMQRKMDHMVSLMEMKVANECKEAFAELQTDMSEVTHALAVSNQPSGYTRLPYRSYTYFCINHLFPNQNHAQHPVLSKLEIPRANFKEFDIGFRRLSDLLKDRTFVVVVVRALEAQTTFTQRDRSNFASLLSSALQSKMEYFTDLLKVLLVDLIKHSVERRKEKLLFRRSESVAEKMLANWLTFLLYDYLLDRAGEPLYLLIQAIWLQISRGPVDAITDDSRYALSDDKILRESVPWNEVRLTVIDPQGTFENTRNSNDPDWQLHVKVLDCDTITQVKEKILFFVYRHMPYSSRYSADDIELELVLFSDLTHPEKVRLAAPRLVMQDIDETTVMVRNGPTRSALRRLNTLKHYMNLWNFKPDAVVKCNSRNIQYDTNSFKATENSSLVNSTSNLIGTLSEHTDILSSSLPTGNHTGTLDHSSSYPHFPNTLRSGTMEDGAPKITDVHLTKPNSDEQREEAPGRSSKIVLEVGLNRLLVTKNCIQRYVDDFLRTVFAVAPDAGGNACDMVLPVCIKYIFDFLDEQALTHNIADPEVIHVWKSNCLPLRFWVGVVLNPSCIFDLQKTPAVDGCLNVVAQTLMESCNWSKTTLTKESPISKLLFAKDMDSYRELVLNYYKDIKSIPAISDQDINAHLIAHSNKHINDFNGSSAFHTLYVSYICKYKKQIEEALEMDDAAKRQRLAMALQEVHHHLDQSQTIC